MPTMPTGLSTSRPKHRGMKKGPHDVVVRHERSHLLHCHHRYLLIAYVIDRLFGRIPPISRSVAFLRLEIERWADEDAVVEGSDRRMVSSAVETLAEIRLGSTFAAFGAADLVVGRLDHLRQPRGEAGLTVRGVPYAAVGIGVALVVGSIIFWLT